MARFGFPTYGLQPETLTYASSDAGFRQYFRIQGTGRSYIIMDCPKEKQSMKEFVKVDKNYEDCRPERSGNF